MTESEANEYLSNVVLTPATMARAMPMTRSGIMTTRKPGDLITPGKENGAVIGEAVVGLTDRLSPQNATDVMNCISLGQQMADYKFNKEKNLRGWTDEYYKALQVMGWNTVNMARQSYSPSSSSFSMDQVALEIIQAAAGGATEFVQVARKALIATSEDGKAIQLLENNSASESYATFQTLPCTESARGTPAMIMMSIDFKKSVKTRKVLFFKFTKTQVSIYRAAAQFQLNVASYARRRNQVEDLLNKGADDYFASFKF